MHNLKAYEQAEQIYQEYPRKVGKRAAIRAITAALKRGAGFDALMVATCEFARQCEPKRGTKDWQYVPYPATWYNADRYLDEDDGRPCSFKWYPGVEASCSANVNRMRLCGCSKCKERLSRYDRKSPS
jgi:hypothetical protein